MNYSETTLRKHRRLAILRYLAECQGFTANASILTDVMNDFGVTSTRSQVTTELAWLCENGFVTQRPAGADLIVATATVRGGEIASGHATHPEIQRPRPGQRLGG